MSQSFGEPLTKLRKVPIDDNGELLVDPCTMTDRLHFAEKHPVFEGIIRTPFVRESVAHMLVDAASKLPDGIRLEVLEGYRPIELQRTQYNHLKSQLASQHPEWSSATLNRVTNSLSAPPDDRCPPPHVTGGAVDLYPVYIDSGKMLDMTSPFAWDASSAKTNMGGLSPTAAANRQMFAQALSASGLTNYAGEWWHWSYGDSGWALRTGSPTAVYGRVPEEHVPPSHAK